MADSEKAGIKNACLHLLYGKKLVEYFYWCKMQVSQLVFRLVNTGRVQKDDLAFGPGKNGLNAVSGSLGLVGSYHRTAEKGKNTCYPGNQ